MARMIGTSLNLMFLILNDNGGAGMIVVLCFSVREPLCSNTSRLEIEIEINPKVADRFQVSLDLACAQLPGMVVNNDVVWPVRIGWTKFYYDDFFQVQLESCKGTCAHKQ